MAIAIASNVAAQEKPYLATEGKEWAISYEQAWNQAHPKVTTTFRLQGDTIINGKTYKKIWMMDDIDSTGMYPYPRYMREEAGKVYTTQGQKDEELWFDYTAQVGDTLCFVQNRDYGIVCAIEGVPWPYSPISKLCRQYKVQLGTVSESTGKLYFTDQYIYVHEGIGVLNSAEDGYGLGAHIRPGSYGTRPKLEYVRVDNQILYQAEIDATEPSRELTHRGYGLYYGDSYLYKYTINEAEEVKDSTDFAVWNDKSVIYFDIDTVGTHAFTNATFRQGQILYFSDKLNCIMPDAFTDILMADNKSAEKNPFGDLCIVFSGDDAPCIEKSSISNYADTTYRITYVVPDLAAYIGEDIQWTYTTLVTIDDFIKGYVSPENEVTVTDSTEVDVTVDNGNENEIGPTGSDVNLNISARPRKEIPVRIGDGENKDIYSRAPAWMRYTVELEITDTEETLLFADSKECTAYEDCEFDVTFTRPENNTVYVRSRSIDQYDRTSEWAVETVNLDTAIGNIIIPTTDDAPYYDLMGRKVAHPTRGIYIRNGRKIIVE